MTVPKMMGAALVLMVALAVQPLSAQKASEYQWTGNRPDAQAPISLTTARTLGSGELQLSVKYVNDRYKGQGIGTDSLTLNEVLTTFTVAPTEFMRRGAEVNLAFGITDHLTLLATGTFTHKEMEMVVMDPNDASLYWIANSQSVGPEDVKVEALFNVVEQGGARVHFSGGASIPVGAIDYDDLVPDPARPGSNSLDLQLPYIQQLGSGTVDLLPGITADVQNEVASLGFQAKAVIRTGENDRGWTLGDIYTGTVWGAYKAADWASVSVGARYTTWGNIEGYDEVLATSTSQAFDSPAYNSLTAGSRVEIPMGVNFYVDHGRFQGHRFSVEFLVPVHQSLDYTQFRRDWSVVMGWQKGISF